MRVSKKEKGGRKRGGRRVSAPLVVVLVYFVRTSYLTDKNLFFLFVYVLGCLFKSPLGQLVIFVPAMTALFSRPHTRIENYKSDSPETCRFKKVSFNTTLNVKPHRCRTMDPSRVAARSWSAKAVTSR